MADHNKTIYDFGNVSDILCHECMMSMRNCKGIANIYIPFSWLHEGISEEDVYRWVEIGNQLIFPATIEKVKNDNLILHNQNYKHKFKDLKITYKRDIRLHQTDANQVDFGTLNSIEDINTNKFRIYSSVYTNSDFINKKYNNWNGWSSDYKLYETGECLHEFIIRSLKEEIKDDNSEYNGYKITIDCSKSLSDNHRLAILSFYRFLWSAHFKNVVKNTLKIIDTGVNAWDAMYYALNTKDYSSYYGFLNCSGFASIDFVVNNLKSKLSVNASFSSQTKCPLLSMNVTDFGAEIRKYKEEEFSLECTTKDLKSLTFGKTYIPLLTSIDYYIVKCDDFYKRQILKSNFKKVKL